MKVTKEQILRASLAYFASHDYEGVSLNDIAGTLNITKGGIYHYFRSKDELFRDAVIYVMDQMEHSLDQEAFSSMEPKDILELFFDVETFSSSYYEALGIDILKDYKSVVYLVFTAMKKFPEVEEKIRASYIGITQAIEYFFRAAAAEGKIRKDLDYGAISYLLSAYIEGGMLLSAVGANEGGQEMNVRVFNFFWSILIGENSKGVIV
ncbi:MAG: TetR/AcrR family transcriptional regulator [Spirochaetales bacterium]|nr:TetR/AcrR family transcriptional regulator [Spirochaetales bacterium]